MMKALATTILLGAATVAVAQAGPLKGDDAAWRALFTPAAAARAAAAAGIRLSSYAPRGAGRKPAGLGAYDGGAYLATGTLPGGGTLVVSGDAATRVGTIAFVLQATGPATAQKAQLVAAERKFFAAAGIKQPGVASPLVEAASDGFTGDGNLNVPTGTSVTRQANGARQIAVYYGAPVQPPS